MVINHFGGRINVCHIWQSPERDNDEYFRSSKGETSKEGKEMCDINKVDLYIQNTVVFQGEQRKREGEKSTDMRESETDIGIKYSHQIVISSREKKSFQ